VREVLKKLPVVGPAARALARLPHRLRVLRAGRRFRGSADHWEEKYASGGDSGRGSYGVLTEFKAEVLNDFVADFSAGSVVELGCGDGNQLSLAHYPSYLGLDVSSPGRARSPTSTSFLAARTDEPPAALEAAAMPAIEREENG